MLPMRSERVEAWPDYSCAGNRPEPVYRLCLMSNALCFWQYARARSYASFGEDALPEIRYCTLPFLSGAFGDFARVH